MELATANNSTTTSGLNLPSELHSKYTILINIHTVNTHQHRHTVNLGLSMGGPDRPATRLPVTTEASQKVAVSATIWLRQSFCALTATFYYLHHLETKKTEWNYEREGYMRKIKKDLKIKNFYILSTYTYLYSIKMSGKQKGPGKMTYLLQIIYCYIP